MESIVNCIRLINPEPLESDDSLLADLKHSLRKSIDDLDLALMCDVLIQAQRTHLWRNPDMRSVMFAHCFYNLFCQPFNRLGEEDDPDCESPRLASDKALAMLELILAAGGDPKFADTRGLTCLHWLAQRSDDAAELEKVMTILVKAGCNIEARDAMYGASALAWAAYQG